MVELRRCAAEQGLRRRRHARRHDGRRGADVQRISRQGRGIAQRAIHRLVRVLSRASPHAVGRVSIIPQARSRWMYSSPSTEWFTRCCTCSTSTTGSAPGSRREAPCSAEEQRLTWWHAVVHHRVFPEWLAERRIFEINDDFMLSAEDRKPQVRRGDGIRSIRRLSLGRARPSPAARRRELHRPAPPISARVIASFESRPEAAFLRPGAAEHLAIPVAFDRNSGHHRPELVIGRSRATR